MDNLLTKELRKNIIDEVSLWIADTYKTTVMQVKDLDAMQTVVEDVVWKHVQALKLHDAMNERVCYLYLVGDTLVTIATAFLSYAAQEAGIKTHDLYATENEKKNYTSLDNWDPGISKTKKKNLN